ncbi:MULTISPECIES: hypothetical protein [unclassified Methylobacterium]|uniref:hypothetical protein n=1 Tax=unclassified Methylobacterium TaxID=2615210 RepID=UPI00226AA847|nr:MULTISPECIES: hypothetical protein [unclassified Methylobacterium]
MQDYDQWLVDRVEKADETSESILTNMHLTDESWGFYCWGDAPGGIGGGVGVFYWFPNLPKLCGFLAEHGAFIFPVSGRKDMRIVASEVKIAANKIINEDTATAVTDQINTVLKGEAQFEWIGRYVDLLAGNGEFPRRLRSQFRGGENDYSSIEANERPEFDDFLATYGV